MSEVDHVSAALHARPRASRGALRWFEAHETWGGKWRVGPGPGLWGPACCRTSRDAGALRASKGRWEPGLSL